MRFYLVKVKFLALVEGELSRVILIRFGHSDTSARDSPHELVAGRSFALVPELKKCLRY